MNWTKKVVATAWCLLPFFLLETPRPGEAFVLPSSTKTGSLPPSRWMASQASHLSGRTAERLAASQSNVATTVTREHQVDLSTGVSMQVLSSLPTKPQGDMPPLLFLHGSFHGAWCWAEEFFPYFTNLGYPVVALSWRGTGGTFAGEGVKKVKIEEHVADLEAFLEEPLESIVGLASARRPVLIAHSFGSLAIMKDLEIHPERCSQLSGVAILCGVPPSGNGKLTMRYLRRSLVDSWKITAGFAMKRCTENMDLCRELFFGGKCYELPDGTVEDYGISDSDMVRYQSYFARDSTATIDLIGLAKCLPSATAVDGVAPFANSLPSVLVLGAFGDFIVDEMGVDETAGYFGIFEPVMVDSPHDVMLGAKWKNTADALATWLQEMVAAQEGS
jgi:pimeloyl-ACP methyl ester carboxylesterase